MPGAVAALIERQPLSRAKVTFAWRTAVGSPVARATTVELGRDGTLEVRALDRHWRRELHRSSGLILTRLGTLLGPDTVKKLEVT